MIANAPARVINVASQTISDTRQIKLRSRPRPVALDLDDLQAEHDFKPMHAYARAKASHGHVWLSAGPPTGWHRCHRECLTPRPGGHRHGARRHQTLPRDRPGIPSHSEQGARTAIHLATSPQVEGVTGKYYISNAEHASPDISYDTTLQERLWQASAQLVGLTKYPHQT